MEFFNTLGPEYLFRSPILVAWIIGIIISARMLKREGSRAERLLLTGCILMFAEVAIRPFQHVFISWYFAQHGSDIEQIGLFSSFSGVPLSLMSLGGIVCLVFAFWTRWKSQGATQQTPIIASDNQG